MRFTYNSFLSGFRKFGNFSFKELLRMIIVSIVFGFIFSFRKWGENSYNPLAGLTNWFIFSVFSFLTLFFMLLGGKFASIRFGYRLDYRMWKLGLVTNVFITFITNGFSVFLLPGGFDLKMIESLQLGKYIHGYSPYRKRAYIVFWSLFSMFFFVTMIKFFLPENLAFRIVLTSVVVSAWSLFPLEAVIFYFVKEFPPSFGSCLIMGPVSFTVFTVVFYIINVLILFFSSGIIPIFMSIILSALAFFVYITFISPAKLYKG
ncbi:MAG: hypothetical protein ACQER9_00185 [Nanobdellota archaeon]